MLTNRPVNERHAFDARKVSQPTRCVTTKDENYRNTAEIQAFAETLIADSSYLDIDDGATVLTGGARSRSEEAGVLPGEDRVNGRTRTSTLRHGPAPEIVHFASRTAHDTALVARIRRAVESDDLSLGDIAVLCDTNGQASATEKLLASAGIPSINLLEYQGAATEKVKVGTTKRAKSLEFKLVLLPWSCDTHAVTDDERAARNIRERYVAATRARDLLWIGTL